MSRPKAFDVDEAVERAMRTFWRYGYRGTSVRDLCEAMEIGSGSFYATFGSKSDLFRLALVRYLRSVGLEPGPAAIPAYLERVISDRDPTGCLLVGSAVEHDSLEPDAKALVATGFSALEDFFWRCLEGRAGARRDARLLATAVAGLHVLHRTGAGTDQLRAITDRLLESLDIPRSSS